MKFFITDSEKSFSENKSRFKFLFKGYIIEKWNFSYSPDDFNLALNGIEYKAADAMHVELNAALERLENVSLSHNKFVATRNTKRDIHFSLLYNSYWQLVVKKQVLRLVIEKLLQLISEKISEIELDLNEEFRLAEVDFQDSFKEKKLAFNFRETKISAFTKLKPLLKNWGYYTFHLYKKLVGYSIPKHPNKKNILLLIYDVPSLHIVLERFYELVKKSKEVHLTLVVLSSGIAKNKAIDAQNFSSQNITVLDYTLFRNGNNQNHSDLYKQLESWHPAYAIIRKQKLIENLEDHYAWIGTAIEAVKPDVCFTVSLSETGRAISDAARYFSVPCVNVEYGINTDDPLYFNSNTNFTIRACIGEANQLIWKKRNDPSEQHYNIGFCKLDKLIDFKPNPADFFQRNKLDATRPSLFFASSWTSSNKSYDLEKQTLVDELSKLCHKRNWNLLIKKHPAETDSLVKDIIDRSNFANQLVFNHADITLHELVCYCTVATTQSSSMFAETLYFEKPFCFLNKSKEGGITELYTSINEDGLFETYRNMEDFERFVEQLMQPEELIKFKTKAQKLKEKYLYKVDGLSSERLLKLLIEAKN